MQASTLHWKNIGSKPLTLICILSVIQLIVAFGTDPMSISFDESMWQYIGRNWIKNGMVPYQGGVDNKSPLIFLIFGISDWFFGINYWFPRLLGVAVQSLGVYFLYKIAEKTINKQAAIFALSFYGLSLIWRSTGGKYVSYTETYALTFTLMAVYFSIVCNNDKKVFIGGLFAGLGFGFRLTALFGIIPILLFTFKRNPKTGVIFLTGMMTSVGIVLIFLGVAGIKLTDLLFFGVMDNFGSGSATAHGFAWKVQRFSEGFFYSEIILFYPAVIGYFFLVRKLDFLKAWLGCEFLGIVFLGMYDRSHFKGLLPVLSLMSAFVVSFLIRNQPLPPRIILLGIWIVFFPKTFEPLYAFKKLLNSGNKHTNPNAESADDDNIGLKKTIGLWIRSHTHAGEKVYVAGYGAEIQLYSKRISPSIYFNVTQTLYSKNRLFRDLLSDKPAMIAVPMSQKYVQSVDVDLRGFIDSLTAKDYDLDTSLYHYNIYRLGKRDSLIR